MRINTIRLGWVAAAIMLWVFLLVPQPARALDSEPSFKEAQAVCVTDTYGKVIYGHNEYEEMPPASLTKVMTAMVALDSGISLDTEVPFVVNEFSEGAQLSGYTADDTPTLRELLMVTLVYSGNDAALNVALAVAGSQEAFADLMNAKCEQLGLTHTHFMNPHGLEEEGHYTCAYDMCVIGRYAMEHYPFIREAVHTPEYKTVAGGQEVTFYTTDHLMGTYEGLRGIKTGNTESGASFLGSARRGHVTLYSCVLCCATEEGRFDDSAIVLDWAFGLYASKALAHQSWILRVAPWQDGFWLRCPVSAVRDATGQIYPEGDVTYTTVNYKPNTLVGSGMTYGTTVWQQDGRLVEDVTYKVGHAIPVANTAWNPIERPLFAN